MRARQLAPLLFVAATLAACASRPTLEMSPERALPQHIQDAPSQVREAYRYAVANRELLEQIPCYCGCGAMGHTSNYACYASGVDAQGAPLYDDHALGCGICVDITRDVMRMAADGLDVAEMRSAIDRKYAAFGPSNMP